MLQKTPIVTGNAKRGKLCDQKESKGKRLQQRKSIADAGTSWESGVRRSTRFTTKPLECWKGERTVYGRVHESLSTVIGVKCMCPGSDGKPKMKAKSFVSVLELTCEKLSNGSAKLSNVCATSFMEGLLEGAMIQYT
ncbi:hypothetical protein P8452_28468 [Trifolium repens]|nr:hypothetical protein P8452_28468 [Trifolium repens]